MEKPANILDLPEATLDICDFDEEDVINQMLESLNEPNNIISESKKTLKDENCPTDSQMSQEADIESTNENNGKRRDFDRANNGGVNNCGGRHGQKTNNDHMPRFHPYMESTNVDKNRNAQRAYNNGNATFAEGGGYNGKTTYQHPQQRPLSRQERAAAIEQQQKQKQEEHREQAQVKLQQQQQQQQQQENESLQLLWLGQQQNTADSQQQAFNYQQLPADQLQQLQKLLLQQQQQQQQLALLNQLSLTLGASNLNGLNQFKLKPLNLYQPPDCQWTNLNSILRSNMTAPTLPTNFAPPDCGIGSAIIPPLKSPLIAAGDTGNIDKQTLKSALASIILNGIPSNALFGLLQNIKSNEEIGAGVPFLTPNQNFTASSSSLNNKPFFGKTPLLNSKDLNAGNMLAAEANALTHFSYICSGFQRNEMKMVAKNKSTGDIPSQNLNLNFPLTTNNSASWSDFTITPPNNKITTSTITSSVQTAADCLQTKPLTVGEILGLTHEEMFGPPTRRVMDRVRDLVLSKTAADRASDK